NAGVPAGAFANSVAIDPMTPSTVYVGYGFNFGVGGGIAKSTDGGVSGEVINAGLPQGVPIGPIVIDPTIPATLYAGTSSNGGDRGKGVFKSTDAGASWNDVANSGPTTLDIRALALDPISANTIYAGGAGGLLKSSNGGERWDSPMAFEIPSPTFSLP